MNHPIDLLNLWLVEEKQRGAPNPQQAVLSTATDKGIPHARVVAIREIGKESFIFFTQRETRKVKELNENPYAAMIFWFELYQREVIIDGIVESLTAIENAQYWQHYPREAQLRFHSYAPTSAQPIISKQALEDKKQQIEYEYQNKPVPLSPFYCGFRLKPQRMVFYTYRTDELSDVFEYQCINGEWLQQLLSP